MKVWRYGAGASKISVKTVCNKSVSEMAAASSSAIEIQVELEGPDAPGGFDDWLNSTILRPSRS